MNTLIFIILIVLVIWLGPLLAIWSVNTLFPIVAIPYTVWTWLAALILFGSVFGFKN